MRLSLYVATVLLLEQFSSVAAFSIFTTPSRRQTSLVLSAETEAPEKKKATSAADILARARKSAGLPEEEDAPKIFEESLYDDMQQILQTLERRVKGGPGSLSLPEVEELSTKVDRVLVEMKEKEQERVQSLSAAAPAAAAAVQEAPAQAATVEAAPPAVETLKPKEIVDNSEDEGPEFDGPIGGVRDTRNTYAIPGMEEMNPEEYQKALAQMVIERSRASKKAGRMFGNLATWDYLNHLGDAGGIYGKESSDE